MKRLVTSALFLSLILLSSSGAVSEAAPQRVLILGDSLTAGFGMDESRSYPALLEKLATDNGISVEITNAGVSGDTSAGGLRRIQWLLKSPVDIFVLALGTNDALRGLSLSEAQRNLQAIIDAVRGKYPDAKVVIAGMKLPPNFGLEYAQQFEEMFPKLARENKALLIPFLLEGVAGDPTLNFPDRLHPNEEGQRRVAATVWKFLEPLLRGRSGVVR